MTTGTRDGSFRLESRSFGALPVVNHFLGRIGLEELLERYVPHTDRRCRIAPSRALGLLLRNILLGRSPVYALEQWAAPFDPALLGVAPSQIPLLNDDRVGRSLDRLFSADRASLLTEIVVRAVREFGIDLTQIHNDSTTITFSGEYAGARGRPRRGRPTLSITHGFNKDHRPDLKQLLWILTVSADGAVPVHFRACDGNTTDDQTHIDTWSTLRKIVKRTDFLYVADSKLCTRPAMDYIAREGGRFLTVLPRTRREDTWFRDWVQTHNPQWVEVRRRRNPRREGGPPDIYRVVESPVRSVEGYRIVWVWSSLKAEQDQRSRQARIEKGILALEVLETRLRGKRSRFKDDASVSQAAETALQAAGAQQWIDVTVHEVIEDSFRQETQGRPGMRTRYLRRQRRRFRIEWRPRPETIDYDAHTDGIFPLLTNDENLPAADVLEKYKYQPQLEKRHEQLKTVRAVAPVLLKSVTRIEALLMVYFLALLVDALIEREMRRAMKAARIPSLPLYPEDRLCRAPTTDRLIEILGDLRSNVLLRENTVIQTFHPDLSDMQREILRLLGVPLAAYEQGV
ncbi:MAG: IS1634 family transposase [Candidatus Deferrimicrobium sp.]